MKKRKYCLIKNYAVVTTLLFLFVVSSCAPKTSEGFFIPQTRQKTEQKKKYSSSKSSRKIENIQYTREQMNGIASWYGPNFHGKKTANGEIYNQNANTVAHKILPINTKIKITNLENGKWVTARVNDRGPYKKNRIIDVSKKIAKNLQFLEKGTAKVRLDVIRYPQSYDPKLGIAPYKQKVVQIVSYDNPQNLLENFSKVKVKIYPITIFADQLGNKEYHIVAGPFYSAKNAEIVSQTIRKKGFASFVRSYRK